MSYVGRFAPSPSGPLHFGSLVCALASFLHAKQHKGKWLLRIEDIDTPRVDAKMNAVIINSLKAHGFMWDDELIYQSQRHQIYNRYLQTLKQQNYIYSCACSRKQIRARSGSYDGFCRDQNLPLSLLDNQYALRFKHVTNHCNFVDGFWGTQDIRHPIGTEDPVLKRADGIYAYHLAVVADDIEQGVTHIVRGVDILDTTPVHLSLYQALNSQAPAYMHIPVVVQAQGEKLSKQHHSPAIDDKSALSNLQLALVYLGIAIEKQPNFADIDELLSWTTTNWSINQIQKQTELLISTKNGVYSLP